MKTLTDNFSVFLSQLQIPVSVPSETDMFEEYSYNADGIKIEPDILPDNPTSSEIEDSTVFTLTFPEMTSNGGNKYIYVEKKNNNNNNNITYSYCYSRKYGLF